MEGSMIKSFTIGATAIDNIGVFGTSGKFQKANPISPIDDGKDHKLERIINKFKSGKKLSSGELSYLAQKSPEMYNKVVRIMKQREMLEQRLEKAQSKEEAAEIIRQEMQAISSNGADEFEKTALLNHTMDAYSKYMAGGSSSASDDLDVSMELFHLNKQSDPEHFFNRRELHHSKRKNKQKNLQGNYISF
jgi:hypothetical protein